MSQFEETRAVQTSIRRGASLAVIFSLCVFGMGQSFIFTSIPPIGREIGLSESQVGLIMMSGAIVLVFFSFYWGQWVNKIGLRRAMQIGMIAYAATTLALGLVFAVALNAGIDSHTAFLLAIAFRVIFSAASGGVFPSAQAFFVATSTPETRTSAIASMGIAFSLGMMIGPALAALASNISLDAPFYIMAGLGFCSFALLQFFMPQTLHSTNESENDDSTPVKIAWLTHPVLPFLILIMIVSLCMNAIQQIAVFYIQDLLQIESKGAAQRGGAAMTLMSVMMITVQIIAAQRLKLSPVLMINFGAAVFLVSMLVFVFANSWTGYLLAMGLFGAGVGFLYPAVIASQTFRAAPHEQGHVAGANVSAQGLGLVVGPITSASLYQLDATYPFILVSALSIVILMINSRCAFSQSLHPSEY